MEVAKRGAHITWRGHTSRLLFVRSLQQKKLNIYLPDGFITYIEHICRGFICLLLHTRAHMSGLSMSLHIAFVMMRSV